MNNRVRGDSFEVKDQRYNLITGLSGETEAAVGSAGQERSLIPRWKGSVSRRRRKMGPHGLASRRRTRWSSLGGMVRGQPWWWWLLPARGRNFHAWSVDAVGPQTPDPWRERPARQEPRRTGRR